MDRSSISLQNKLFFILVMKRPIVEPTDQPIIDVDAKNDRSPRMRLGFSSSSGLKIINSDRYRSKISSYSNALFIDPRSASSISVKLPSVCHRETPTALALD